MNRITAEEYKTLMERPKKSKYRNKPTLADGHLFDSKKEASHYLNLKRLLQAKKITQLEIQPEYLITINGRCSKKKQLVIISF